ncbi:MAG TPA: tetratricopeptide repeat protein [Pirellulales bacterium]|jgi:tetratricopeptide (TPR) repeat protein|nr:tetratricopeptide repeat protein [Pirellulales bacterium]
MTRRTTWLAAGIIALAALAVYSNSFEGDFIFDDLPWIVINPTIHKLWPLKEVLFPSNSSFQSGRPVVNLTLAINYAFAGTDVRSYHAVNLGIHILAAVTLFGVVRRTLKMPVLGERFARAATPLALSVALVWVVHPLTTAAVSYVIQRTEALVGLFYLLTLYCVIRGAGSSRPIRWYLAAITTCLLGMATKEVMATAPVVVLLYDRIFLSGSFSEALRRRWGLYLALCATWGAIVWCLLSTGFHSGSAGFGSFGNTDDSNFAALSYAATQPGVIVHYLQLAFWPVGMCLDYKWPAAHLPEQIIAPALLVAALLGLTIWGLLKNSPLGFLGAWFFVILAPTSSFVPIRDAAFDHRMYLPLAAIAAMVVIGGFAICDWLALRGLAAGDESSARRWAAPTCLLAATIIGLGWCTVRRNEDYTTGTAIWQDVLDKNPDNARAHNNLAVQLLDHDKIDEAMVHCRRALELEHNYADAESNLGLALAKQHKYEEALPHYRRALELKPEHKYALDLLAAALTEQGNFTEAIDLYDRLLRIDPDNAKTHFDLANSLRKSGQPEAAIEHFKIALAAEPDYPEAHNNLAGVLARQGKLDEAIIHFNKTLELKPDHADAHYNLGMIFYGRGRIAQAEEHWREALRLQPKQVDYLRPLAWALATSPDAATRNGAEAVKLAQTAVKLSEKPDPAVIGTLAAAYAETGLFPKAVETAEQARDLAAKQDKAELAAELSERIKLYESGKPYHEPRK